MFVLKNKLLFRFVNWDAGCLCFDHFMPVDSILYLVGQQIEEIENPNSKWTDWANQSNSKYIQIRIYCILTSSASIVPWLIVDCQQR